MSNVSTTLVNVADLHEPAVNPNSLEPDKYEVLKQAIEAYGFLQPVLVRKDSTGYVIVDGVHRVRAARELGMVAVPAVVNEMDEASARVVQVGMNRLRGELNINTVAQTLVELTSAGVGLDVLTLTGFSEAEITGLLAAIETPDVLPGDAAPPEALPNEDVLNPKPYVLELKFGTREELSRVKKALRSASGGGRTASLEKGVLALIEGA